MTNGLMFYLSTRKKSWAAGLIYMKIGYRILLEYPNNPIMVNVNRVFRNQRFPEWSIDRANKYLVWPAFKMCFTALAGPISVAHIIAISLHAEGEMKTKIFRSAYPGTMLAWLVIVAMR